MKQSPIFGGIENSIVEFLDIRILVKRPRQKFYNFVCCVQPKLFFTSGGFRGGAGGACLPWAPKFFRFHAVFGKFWQNRMLVPPPGELAPPLENPGSAAVYDKEMRLTHQGLCFSAAGFNSVMKR